MYDCLVTAFGASTPSPFGAAATSNPFGATTNPFGTTNQANNPFAAKPFGSTPTPFGGQTGTSLFGSGASTGVFGATQTPTFGASSSAFGGSTSTPAFGNPLIPIGSVLECREISAGVDVWLRPVDVMPGWII